MVINAADKKTTDTAYQTVFMPYTAAGQKGLSLRATSNITQTHNTHRVTQMKKHSKRAQGRGNVKDQTFALNDSHCAYIETCGSKEQI